MLQIDVDEHPDLAVRFRVRAVPTLVLVMRGRVVERIEGRVSATMLVRTLESHLIEETASVARS